VGNYYEELNLFQKLFDCSMYCHPAVMKVWHLNVPAWENVKLWRNSFGTAYVVCVAVWTALWDPAYVVCVCVLLCEQLYGKSLALWDPACMKVLWTHTESFLIVVFQGPKHCLCLMQFLLTSTQSGNTDNLIKVVTDVCQMINRVLSPHHQAEHQQVSFCWQVPYLVWIDIQYCSKVGRSVAGNVVSSPARDMHGRLLWVLYVVW
jgi:hypothetical protein